MRHFTFHILTLEFMLIDEQIRHHSCKIRSNFSSTILTYFFAYSIIHTHTTLLLLHIQPIFYLAYNSRFLGLFPLQVHCKFLAGKKSRKNDSLLVFFFLLFKNCTFNFSTARKWKWVRNAYNEYIGIKIKTRLKLWIIALIQDVFLTFEISQNSLHSTKNPLRYKTSQSRF